MPECMHDTVVIHTCSHIIGTGPDIRSGIAHGHACPGISEHFDVVAPVPESHDFLAANPVTFYDSGYSFRLRYVFRIYVRKFRMPPGRNGMAENRPQHLFFLLPVQENSELADRLAEIARKRHRFRLGKMNHLENAVGKLVMKVYHDFLLGKEGATDAYIAYAAKTSQIKTPDFKESGAPDMTRAIVGGMGGAARETAQRLLEEMPPLEVAAKHIIPALDVVGDLYERGVIFLPQLIAAAESAKQAFSALADKMKGGETTQSDRRFVLATVKGDIHDIGKNIVKAVVSNYGYKVVDLGRDVDYKVVLDAVESNYPCVLGLSALMTTTAQNMAETIRIVREKYPDVPVLVGGAVITPEYANSIGGVYCKDANATVKALKEIFG